MDPDIISQTLAAAGLTRTEHWIAALVLTCVVTILTFAIVVGFNIGLVKTVIWIWKGGRR